MKSKKKKVSEHDLSGLVLGGLRILSRAEDDIHLSKSGNTVINDMWLCHCDECNHDVILKGKDIRTGYMTSCGCTNKYGPYADLTGKVFGSLTVLNFVKIDDKSDIIWHCKCTCPNEIDASSYELLSGRKQSCGHMAKMSSYSHGGSHDRLYGVWRSMRYRCNCPTAKPYHNYGGRGIKICDEWDDYEVFKEWAMDNGYDPNAPYGEYTLDRIDPNGDYCPENCRFVSMSMQTINKVDTNYIDDINGERIPFVTFVRKHNLDMNLAYSRYKRGMTAKEIIETPVNDYYHKITVNGVTNTTAYFARMYNMPTYIVTQRIFRLGWDPIEALTTPVAQSNPATKIEYMGTLGYYTDYDDALGFTRGTIGKRIRNNNMTFEQAISTPLTNRPVNAVFFVDPKTRKPINQFSNLIDTPQYQEDLKTFGELIMNSDIIKEDNL